MDSNCASDVDLARITPTCFAQTMSAANTIAHTPVPPYYAVIFTNQRTAGDRGYGAMADRMMELAAQQPGFLGAESTRDANGFGITVSYWTSEEAIRDWKGNTEHLGAQEAGKKTWYADYALRVDKVERAYGK
jgi:heme-degrading monooxygenase HmoA